MNSCEIYVLICMGFAFAMQPRITAFESRVMHCGIETIQRIDKSANAIVRRGEPLDRESRHISVRVARCM